MTESSRKVSIQLVSPASGDAQYVGEEYFSKAEFPFN